MVAIVTAGRVEEVEGRETEGRETDGREMEEDEEVTTALELVVVETLGIRTSGGSNGTPEVRDGV